MTRAVPEKHIINCVWPKFLLVVFLYFSVSAVSSEECVFSVYKLFQFPPKFPVSIPRYHYVASHCHPVLINLLLDSLH